MSLITRKEWGARPSKGATSVAGTRGVKVHYTGATESAAMKSDHQACVRRVRAIQDEHMDGRGWNDIAYSMIVCWHGDVFVGRGPLILTAANGAGLNAGHYSVLGLVGNKGLTQPSKDMEAGIREAIAYLRRKGNAGDEIKGHRNGYATDCPGEPLYALVRSGALEPEGKPQFPDEEDPVSYVSLTRTKPLQLEPGKWTALSWDREASDKDDHHSGAGATILRGPGNYRLSATLRLSAFGAGHEGQIRAIEVDPKKPAATDEGPIREWLSSDGDTFVGYDLATDMVGEGRSVQLEVVHFHPVPVTLTWAQVKATIER